LLASVAKVVKGGEVALSSHFHCPSLSFSALEARNPFAHGEMSHESEPMVVDFHLGFQTKLRDVSSARVVKVPHCDSEFASDCQCQHYVAAFEDSRYFRISRFAPALDAEGVAEKRGAAANRGV